MGRIGAYSCGFVKFGAGLLPTRWGFCRTVGPCTVNGRTWAKHLHRPAGPAANVCRRCHTMAPTSDRERMRRLKAITDRQQWALLERRANPMLARTGDGPVMIMDEVHTKDMKYMYGGGTDGKS